MVRRLQVKTPLPNSIKTPLLEGKSRVLLEFLFAGKLWHWVQSARLVKLGGTRLVPLDSFIPLVGSDLSPVSNWFRLVAQD